MVKQPYYVQPWRKVMESYSNFSGGLNTVATNDNLTDTESPDLINVDLGERGSLKSRYGFVRHYTAPTAGKGQGYFRYYKDDGTFDEVYAIGGKLYGSDGEIPIDGLDSFQTDRVVEAAQLGDKLYIATGTKLVEYDSDGARVVEPYTPDPLEALYIGTNGLADNPDQYLEDGVGGNLQIAGVTIDKRYGVVNAPSLFTVYVLKPSGMTVEYEFKYRLKGEEEWTVGQAFSSSKTWTFTPTAIGEFEMYITARDSAAQDTVAEYALPTYKVNETDQNEEVETASIHSCNRILTHWDRLVLYGDTTQPEIIYFSHLHNGAYFPTTNTLAVEDDQKEGVSRIVRYRDILVAFTPTSIQAIFGKSPMDFQRVKLHPTIGAIAPDSVEVMENYVTFLSHEGIQILKSVSYTENRLNVEKIDTRIHNIVPRHKDACGAVFDNQYHLLFPQDNLRVRYYYNFGRVWTRDVSEKLNFSKFYKYGDDLYGQDRETGNVFRFDKDIYTDDGHAYQVRFGLKAFDFGAPYNPKKLKELQLLLRHYTENVSLEIYVYADAGLVVDPDVSDAYVREDGSIEWRSETKPNLVLDAGTVLGQWRMGISAFGNVDVDLHKLRLSGKARRMRVVIERAAGSTTPIQLLGLGAIFKLKKP